MPSLMIDPAVAQSFAALLLAHVLADFTFQADWMVRRKQQPLVLLCHIAVVFALTTLLLGGIWQVALVVSLAHLIIDAIKTWALPDHIRTGLRAFLIDQAAHILTLVCAAIWWPGAITQGIWADYAALALPPAILLTGFVLSVTAGGYVVGMLTARWANVVDDQEPGLPDAGKLIGQLERSMIFLLVVIGQPGGVGFLIAAKSVLRLDTAKQGRQASEYVIIGTMASFAWALGSTYAMIGLLEIATKAP
ncbi:DUF3307 domain-containing protein [Tropicibacter sp. R15_0]|uniref:DUF3307 domain-containing protein n=1 Tax=Tropicibacter sp. R15_0 TaxID=2821101 RepID=UPI001ADA6257|nr:DUF3307 domain-containing protein [Tropicibacter sp. R15_0]MBO9464521.1 DUF3307 domain-containing protein [Tropicibacter sp. R15_0]